MDETLGGLFSDAAMPLQCTKTCEYDADCSRGTCEKENDGGSIASLFGGRFGAEAIKLCIPTCAETADCNVGQLTPT